MARKTQAKMTPDARAASISRELFPCNGMPDPAMAAWGERLMGRKRKIVMPDMSVYKSPMAIPKPTMSEETKKALRERAKSVPRNHDNGDMVARVLRECETLEDVYATGSDYLEIPIPDLHRLYDHLNPGQQRMVIGNRMRAKFRKEHPQ